MPDTGPNLARLLSPSSLAVVGANETLGMSNNAVMPMLEVGREVFLVNPRRDTLYGQPVFPDLASIGRPVDAVLSLVNAQRAVDTVEEAGALGCGGVVVAAAGFLEAGAEGKALQARLLAVTDRDHIAVVGPNCAGFKNVPLGVNLFTGGRLDLPSAGVETVGGVSIVSQSGFLARSAMAAAKERALGVSIAVSSGNEAVCDLADYVRVLAGDEHTSVICLVVEAIRRPREFFDAVGEARSAGKPVIATKLGRSTRSRRIMASHTGAIADDAWVYDLAFREYGVIATDTIDDLLDRAQLFVQWRADRWTPITGIGIISSSGGVAALATDLADAVGAPLPALPEIEEWILERVPGDTVNPLDLTGFVMTKAELVEEVFDHYAQVVDLLVLGWWAGHDDEGWARTLLAPFSAAAQRHQAPFVVSPVEATGVGAWVADWRPEGLAFCRGLQSVFSSVDAMNRFLRDSARAPEPELARSSSKAPDMINGESGPMVRFADAMALLAEAGIVVAPWALIEEKDDTLPEGTSLGDRLVVKLADVAHRTDHHAVRIGVAPSALAEVVSELRAIAYRDGLPATVVVQAMVTGHGEAFVGLQGRTSLGAVTMVGLGGVLVEVMRRVTGRFLPLDAGTAHELAGEVTDAVASLRGQKAWSVDSLASVIRGIDRLWRDHRGWLTSIDINPLVVTDEGFVAVDALLLGQVD